MIKLQYDSDKYDFATKVRHYLDFENLPKVHEEYKFEDVLKEGTDQNQFLHTKFYKGMDTDPHFTELYVSFVREVIAPRYDGELLYQKFPTFRVHQPGNVGTFGWHKDSDYNHSPKEVNYYMPMTSGYNTNTIWHESEPGKKDFRPMVVEYGDIVEWDGANCEHGTKINETNDTRISFDFRVLTLKNYHKFKPKESITKGTKLDIGHYFGILKQEPS